MKEFLKYIESGAYRKWLEDLDYISDWDYMDIILNARADIRVKLDDLKKLNDIKLKIDDHDALLFENIKGLEKAIAFMTETSPETIFIRGARSYDGNEMFSVTHFSEHPYKSFTRALEDILDDADEYEMDEDSIGWNIINRYDLRDGEYWWTAAYTVGYNAEVWAASYIERYSDDSRFRFNMNMGEMNLSTPYKSGDIVTIDCRPFQKPFHAVVIRKKEPTELYVKNFEDDSSISAIFVKNDRILCKSIKKKMLCSPDAFSPLLRIDIFNDDLPKDEKLLGEIAEYIRTHEDGAEKIANLNFEQNYHKARKAEKMLRKLLAEA